MSKVFCTKSTSKYFFFSVPFSSRMTLKRMEEMPLKWTSSSFLYWRLSRSDSQSCAQLSNYSSMNFSVVLFLISAESLDSF